jgi:hypothetical protein
MYMKKKYFENTIIYVHKNNNMYMKKKIFYILKQLYVQ